MKRFLTMVAAVAMAGLLAACPATMPPGTAGATPTQTTINATKTSYDALVVAIDSADAAVKANLLKGKDAANTLAGLTQAKAGLDLALTTLRAANAAAAASGAAK